MGDCSGWEKEVEERMGGKRGRTEVRAVAYTQLRKARTYPFIVASGRGR